MRYETFERAFRALPEEQRQIVYNLVLSLGGLPQWKKKTLAEIRSYMKGGKSVPDGVSTVDYVRSLRAD